MSRFATSLATAAVVAILGPAAAQTPGEGTRAQEQIDRSGERLGQREEERLRDALRAAGFRRIQVVDAAYIVRAETPDGRTVVMYLDPPPRTVSRTSDGMSRDRRTTGSMSGRQELNVREGDRDQVPTAAGVRELEPLTPQTARAILRVRGLSNVRNLQREGDHYTATAEFFGEEVDVRVDARTGVVEFGSS